MAVTAAPTLVADGIWVQRNTSCRTNSTIIAGEGQCLLVDPGVDGQELAALAAFLAAQELQVVAGVSTHPHFDHLLWHAAFGDVPRWAGPDGVAESTASSAAHRDEAEKFAPGADLDLVGRTVALPPGADRIAWGGRQVRLLGHRAHAPGHLALLVEPGGVLLAGDMLSDAEIPLLDLQSPDPLGDYRQALDRLEQWDAGLVIPGHGAVGDRAELRRRLAADRAYLQALAAGGGDDDPRLMPGDGYGADWMPEAHLRQRERYRTAG